MSARASTSARLLRGAVIPAAVLIVWQIVPYTGLISATKLPPLSAVLVRGWELLVSGQLLIDIGASLARVAVGFSLSVVIGVLLGYLFSQSWILGKLFDPLMQALRLTPVVAAAPLFILWFGFGEGSKIAIVAAMGVFAMYLAAFTAFRSASPELAEVTTSLGLGQWWVLTRFLIPSALPRLISGGRFALLLSWMSLAVAERIGTDVGVGNLAISTEAITPENIFVGTILFAVLAKGSDWAFVTATRPLVAWENTLASSGPTTAAPTKVRTSLV